jgi:hypothetical protein
MEENFKQVRRKSNNLQKSFALGTYFCVSQKKRGGGGGTVGRLSSGHQNAEFSKLILCFRSIRMP